MGFTLGQDQKLRTIRKANFTGLAPRRQVAALANWVRANNRTGGLEVFPLRKSTDLAQYVEDIANYLGIYTDNPTFQTSLKSLATSGSVAKDISGTIGYVPASVVAQICDQYKVKPDVIKRAVSNIARAHGDNGVKRLSGGKGAELKLMAMGGERVYASGTTTKGLYQFDRIGKHQ